MPRRIRTLIATTLALLIAVVAGSADAAKLPFQPSAQQGLFLHVTDIHFDPFASLPKNKAARQAALAKLIATPVAQWQQFFQAAKGTPYPHRSDQADTSYPLFAAMLAAAGAVTDSSGKRVRYDYVLNTGDNLSHGFYKAFGNAGGRKADYGRFVAKTLRFVNGMLIKNFRRTPLIYALGNNDAVCGDYWVKPKSAMLAEVGRDLPLVAGNKNALRHFKAGGYYLVRHPTVPKHDIIALNSIFLSAKYKNKCGKAGSDPGGTELKWLASTLAREKAKGRTVSLTMHIPPGIDGHTSSKYACPDTGTSFWQSSATDSFRTLIGQYKQIVSASYAGHTHMDDFRLLSDPGGTPLLATRITPAVTPLFGNNPAFAVMLYGRGSAIVNDSAVVYLTNVDTAGPNEPPKWQSEYDFAQTYGITRYTASNVAGLAKRIAGDSGATRDYTTFYAADAPSPINKDNQKAYICAQTALTPAAYQACRCGAGAPAQPK